MGWNTTVVIMNDSIEEIKNDPQFGEKLVAAILKVDDPVYVGSGVMVVETHHADTNALVCVGGNQGVVFGHVYNGIDVCDPRRKPHEEEGKIAILKELADKFGYNLVKKRKKN